MINAAKLSDFYRHGSLREMNRDDGSKFVGYLKKSDRPGKNAEAHGFGRLEEVGRKVVHYSMYKNAHPAWGLIKISTNIGSNVKIISRKFNDNVFEGYIQFKNGRFEGSGHYNKLDVLCWAEGELTDSQENIHKINVRGTKLFETDGTFPSEWINGEQDSKQESKQEEKSLDASLSDSKIQQVVDLLDHTLNIE